MDFIQVSTTVRKKSEAEKIAKALIEHKLAACIQITGPITSIYLWNGKTEKSKEWLCVIKTTRSHYKKVETMIKKVHSYELPEIIAIPITEGSREYFRWVKGSL